MIDITSNNDILKRTVVIVPRIREDINDYFAPHVLLKDVKIWLDTTCQFQWKCIYQRHPYPSKIFIQFENDEHELLFKMRWM